MDLIALLPENPVTREDEQAYSSKIERTLLQPASSSSFLSDFSAAVHALSPAQLASRTYGLTLVVNGVFRSSSSAGGGGGDAAVGLRLGVAARLFEFALPEQARRLWAEWLFVARQFASTVLSSSSSQPQLRVRACAPLVLALDKLTHSQLHEVTALHVDVIQVCVVSKIYALAVLVLDGTLQSPLGGVTVSAAPPVHSPTLALDLQRFFYYAGIAYAAVERFADALDQFAQCLSMPTRATSAVQFEAFKKYSLTSLIVHGHVLPLPAYCSPPVMRTFAYAAGGGSSSSSSSSSPAPGVQGGSEESLTPAYTVLQRAFATGATLRQVAANAEHAAEFTKSGNSGLVEHVLAAHTKRRVCKLTDTYLTLGYGEVHAHLANGSGGGLALGEIEPYLSRMIARGEIAARLDQRLQVVTFLDGGAAANGVVAKLERELAAQELLAQDLRKFDTRLSTSRQFIKGLTLGRGGGASASKRGGAAMDED